MALMSGSDGANVPRNRSGGAIILGNLVTIVLAMVFKWNLHAILSVYWFQSVIIGYYNYRRILCLKEFSTEGFTSGDDPVPENETGKRATANVFRLHYGFFHVCYLFYIMAAPESVGTTSPIAWLGIIAGCAVFFFSHGYSFRVNVSADLEGKPNLGTMMFMPYLRIIPMHLTIIIGGALASTQWALLLFLGLKTVVDYLMYVVEHRMMRSSKARATE